MLMAFCADIASPTGCPWHNSPRRSEQALFDGDGGEYEGIRGWFAWLETHVSHAHPHFPGPVPQLCTCIGCHGGRLKAEALLTRIRGQDITQIYAMSVGDTYAFFRDLAEAYRHDPAISLLLGEIVNRLQYLVDVGLDYLTLDRQSRTLSGGEVQRVNLTTALGSSLVNTLYILDEPSIGLHPRDSRRLVRFCTI